MAHLFGKENDTGLRISTIIPETKFGKLVNPGNDY